MHALEKEMATHSSVLAWGIPRVEEPGVGCRLWGCTESHDWSDLAASAAAVLTMGNLVKDLQGALLNVMWQPGWEGSLGENGPMYTYG